MEERKQLAEKLRSLRHVRTLIGFDGFVDEIVHVVDMRQDHECYTRIEDMAVYAERVKNGCGLSTNMEIVTVARKLGGNGPIFANALKCQNMHITYIGSVGENALESVFDELAEGSDMIGLTDPSHTDAYEFHDGKIIISKLTPFMSVTWQRILEKVSFDKFLQLFDEAELIGMENWTMLPHMSDIWRHVQAEVTPALTTKPQDKTMFFDLADPEKRRPEDIRDAIGLIGTFTEQGYKTVLGLNRKEACEIAELYGAVIDDYKSYPLEELLTYLHEYVRVDYLVVHPVECACVLHNGAYEEVGGPYCEKPVLTTGAGDNFNAGFVLGIMNRFSPRECLLCGVYVSGFYVRQGRSATSEELADFLRDFKE